MRKKIIFNGGISKFYFYFELAQPKDFVYNGYCCLNLKSQEMSSL